MSNRKCKDKRRRREQYGDDVREKGAVRRSNTGEAARTHKPKHPPEKSIAEHKGQPKGEEARTRPAATQEKKKKQGKEPEEGATHKRRKNQKKETTPPRHRTRTDEHKSTGHTKDDLGPNNTQQSHHKRTRTAGPKRRDSATRNYERKEKKPIRSKKNTHNTPAHTPNNANKNTPHRRDLHQH